MIAETDTKSIDLIASLRGEWLKLPLAAMRDVGPATQTLAGVWKLTRRETFSEVKRIAATARLPTATVRKHLDILHDHGWVKNRGRERTKGGRPRRSCTIEVTKQTRDLMGEYVFLPWWGCLTGRCRMPWSTRAILAVVMSRLMQLVAVVEREEGKADLSTGTIEELWGSISNLGDCDRFRFSLEGLETMTGLSRQSIINAKRDLARRGIVTHYRDNRDDGGTASDMLYPSEKFRVRTRPASEGKIYVEFDPGSKSGQ